MLNTDFKNVDEQPQPLLNGLPGKIAANWPGDQWRDTHVLLAVSGGADSVALLRAALVIKSSIGGSGRLYVGHLNHGLRHTAADADVAWLADICSDLEVPLELANADVAACAEEGGDGLEAAARHARYAFLRQAAERLGARYVVTAHTADDQVETVLHRILRGTGLAGLNGILRTSPLSQSVTLVRPMLLIWRREVMEYLRELGQSYRTDTSNNDLRYTRNRLRHELLPLIRERFNAKVDDALIHLGIQAREVQRYIGEIATDVVNKCVAVKLATDNADGRARCIEFDCTRLAHEPPVVIREALKAAWAAANWPQQSMGFAEWQLLASIVADKRQQPIANLPSNVQVRRVGDLLQFKILGMA